MAAIIAIAPGGTLLDNFTKSFVDVPVAGDQAIATTEFLQASESVTAIFDAMGSIAFTPVKNDIAGNVAKLRERQLEAPDLSGTVQDLCRNELKTKKHKATEGLLWLVRGLEFTCMALDHNQKNQTAEMKESFSDAYAKTLKQHHGFLVRPLFSAAMSACPTRQNFYNKIKAPDTVQAKLDDQLNAYVMALRNIIQILQAFLDTEGKW